MYFMKFQLKNAVLTIIIANAVLFLFQAFIGDKFTDLFILDQHYIFSHPWMYFTSMFLHSGIPHLVLNMLVLFFLGPLLEETVGSRRFLEIYLGAGIVANLLSVFFYERALGASGAVMGVIGVLIILMPNLKVLIYGILPAPLWMVGILYAALDIFGVLYPSSVGSIAHLIGMGFGLLFGLYLKKQSGKFHKKIANKQHLDDEDLDEYLRTGRI